MSDEMDRAQAREEEMRHDALAEHSRRSQPTTAKSASICVRCDEPIPEGRRKAWPGVQLCVDCQRLAERQGRFRRIA